MMSQSCLETDMSFGVGNSTFRNALARSTILDIDSTAFRRRPPTCLSDAADAAAPLPLPSGASLPLRSSLAPSPSLPWELARGLPERCGAVSARASEPFTQQALQKNFPLSPCEKQNPL